MFWQQYFSRHNYLYYQKGPFKKPVAVFKNNVIVDLSEALMIMKTSCCPAAAQVKIK